MGCLWVFLCPTSARAGADADRFSTPASTASRGDETAAIEKEYHRLQAIDDAAQAEVEKWKRENDELVKKGQGKSEAEMKLRTRDRLETVRKAYDTFLRRHPKHAQAHLTYGSFLSEIEDEAAAQHQWEMALEFDPKLAVAYNNLAGIYTEGGQVKKAFDFFSKAIELSPADASFYHNFGDSTYVLRKAAMSQYGLTEQQVYAKALQLYSNAVRLDPTNYLFVSDYAQTYYALTPLPFEQALAAWTNALSIAPDETKRQLACVHLARLKMLSGRLAEAQAHLASVTNQECSQLKSNLLLRIEEREKTH